MWTRFRRRSEYFNEPNEYRILRLVRDAQTISRTEISQQIKLSKPTVSDIVGRLLRGGFLLSVGESTSTTRGGRRRELLRFNPVAGYVIGIDIGMTTCHVAVSDLNANLLARNTFSYRAGSSADVVLGKAADLLGNLLRSKGFENEKLVGVGVGLPGLIERKTGIIRVADTLAGWQGTNIRTFFEERFRVPVYVENDVKARALAEYLFGTGKGIWDQVFVWIGDGIGAGIIIDGKLHHGITESAGEIGYNELGCAIADRKRFPLLYRGQRDFGDILSDSVMIKAYRRHRNGRKPIDVRSVLQAASSGEKTAQQLLDEVASLTSIVCIHLINTLNPELIVIGGKIVEEDGIVLKLVQQKVKDDILSVPAEATKIRPASLGRDGVVLGAVGLVLYDLFKPVRNDVVRSTVPEAALN